MTGRRPKFFSIAFTLAAILQGATRPAGNLAPSRAAHVEFFFIGLSGLPAPVLYGKPRTPPRRPRCQNWLAGFPVPRTQREPPHPAPLLTLHFLFIGLSGLPAAVLYG